MSSITNDATDRLAAELAPEYKVLRVLGEGSVARVFLANEVALQRLVAVKVLRPELSGDERTRLRFGQEARSAARIVHPNVTGVHHVGTLSDGTPFLTMEFIEGRTLDDVLAGGGAMAPEQARGVLRQIAAALVAAHAKRVIHRDVRPGNILLENDTGRVVLSDFGVAGIVESGTEAAARLTQAGEVLGDPRYASPEQLLSESLTTATDVYSLGVVGYELLTLSGPFQASTPAEFVEAHVAKKPRPLLEVRPDAGADLARLLERCLAKPPAQRPLATEVLDALSESAATRDAHAGAVTDGGDTPPVFPALAEFIGELRRRRVYRTAIAYLAGAFILLQGAELVLPSLPLPEWLYDAMVVVLLMGFPLILVLAWIFDISSSGIRRTDVDLTDHTLRSNPRLRLAIEIAAVLVSIGLAAVGWWLLR